MTYKNTTALSLLISSWINQCLYITTGEIWQVFFFRFTNEEFLTESTRIVLVLGQQKSTGDSIQKQTFYAMYCPSILSFKIISFYVTTWLNVFLNKWLNIRSTMFCSFHILDVFSFYLKGQHKKEVKYEYQ